MLPDHLRMQLSRTDHQQHRGMPPESVHSRLCGIISTLTVILSDRVMPAPWGLGLFGVLNADPESHHLISFIAKCHMVLRIDGPSQ